MAFQRGSLKGKLCNDPLVHSSPPYYRSRLPEWPVAPAIDHKKNTVNGGKKVEDFFDRSEIKSWNPFVLKSHALNLSP